MGGAKDSSTPTMVAEDLRQQTVESVVCGHHVYKEFWWLFVGEGPCLHQEETNAHNTCKFAVSLIKDGTVIGHVPCDLSRAFWHFMAHGGTIICEIIGWRKCGKGLEVFSVLQLQ